MFLKLVQKHPWLCVYSTSYIFSGQRKLFANNSLLIFDGRGIILRPLTRVADTDLRGRVFFLVSVMSLIIWVVSSAAFHFKFNLPPAIIK
jgi:hypothetical protein